VGTADHQQEVDEEDQAEDDKGADLKPHGQFEHREAFRRVQRCSVSLSGLPVHLVLMRRPATPGGATMPCVLTIVALGILPYVTLTVHEPGALPLPAYVGCRPGDRSGVPRRLHLTQFLLQFADLVADPGGHLELQFRSGAMHLLGELLDEPHQVLSGGSSQSVGADLR